MKAYLLIIGLLIFSISVSAQNDVVGRWKIIGFKDEAGKMISLRTKQEMLSLFKDLEKNAPKMGDSKMDSTIKAAFVEAIWQTMKKTSIEFKPDRSYVFTTSLSFGAEKPKTERGTYRIDTKTKTITATYNDNKNKRTFDYILSNNQLTLTFAADKENGKNTLVFVRG